MSVLVKDMEMPETCEYCDLCTSDGYCIATGGDSLWDVLPEEATFFPDGWKYEGCPLVEVPVPHGHLIDSDVLIKSFNEMEQTQIIKLIKSLIDLQPTVIEAEDGDAE